MKVESSSSVVGGFSVAGDGNGMTIYLLLIAPRNGLGAKTFVGPRLGRKPPQTSAILDTKM